MNIKNLSLLSLAFALFAGSAHATLISGASLQSNLDALAQGGSFLNVNTDQYAPDEQWTVTASQSSVNLLLFEIATFENTNTFGIYDLADPTNLLELFDGPTGGTATGVLNATRFLSWDSVSNTFTVVSPTLGILGTAVFSADEFGYYLDSSADVRGGLFFSEMALNSDVADALHNNTTDHMVAYAGDGTLMLDPLGGTNYSTFASGEYVLAWEDLLLGESFTDYDYSDFVVLVESVETIPVRVPEPGTLVLLGAGLLGLGIARRSRML